MTRNDSRPSVGAIFEVVQFIEQRRSAFAVSRLIMMTGVPVRRFEAGTVDDPEAVRKIRQALPGLLEPEELRELGSALGW